MSNNAEHERVPRKPLGVRAQCQRSFAGMGLQRTIVQASIFPALSMRAVQTWRRATCPGA